MGHQAVAKGREAGRAEGSDVQGASRPCCSHWAASALRRMPVRSYFRWLTNRKSPSDRREFPWSREKMADRSVKRDGALRQLENTSCKEASLKDAWCPGHDMPRSARSGWGLGSGATRGCETVYDMQTARSTSLVTSQLATYVFRREPWLLRLVNATRTPEEVPRSRQSLSGEGISARLDASDSTRDRRRSTKCWHRDAGGMLVMPTTIETTRRWSPLDGWCPQLAGQRCASAASQAMSGFHLTWGRLSVRDDGRLALDCRFVRYRDNVEVGWTPPVWVRGAAGREGGYAVLAARLSPEGPGGGA